MPWVPIAKGLTKGIRKGIRAFHGSPHDFDKFDISRIGTGEGAQAYGHGLYFAENENVAGSYKYSTAARNRSVTFDGKPIKETRDWWAVQDKLEGEDWRLRKAFDQMQSFMDQGHNVEEALRETKNWLRGDKGMEEAIETVAKRMDIEIPKGKMYEVNINADPEDFLDWDKPLSEQSEKVRNALKNVPEDIYGRQYLFHLPGEETGAERMEQMRQAGIPGIKYLDQGSRGVSAQDIDAARRKVSRMQEIVNAGGMRNYMGGEGTLADAEKSLSAAKSQLAGLEKKASEGTRNYVVFDDKLIDIVKKYGIPGALAAGLLTPDQAEAIELAQAGPQKSDVVASQYDDPDPTFWDTTVAALQQENLIGSAVSSARFMTPYDELYKVDDSYNPYDDEDISDFTTNPDYEDRFVDVFNKKAAQATVSDILREQENRKTLERAGWVSIPLTIGAAVADPTILLPGGAVVKAGRLGYSTARTAATIGLAGGTAALAQETGLYATQQTRTGQEVALNVAGATLLSGIFGAGIAKILSKSEINRLGKALEAELAGEVPNVPEVVETIVQRAQAAGAAGVDDIKLEDLGIGMHEGAIARITGLSAKGLTNATSAVKINPGIQTMLSPSKKTRSIYNQMVENTIYTKNNIIGTTVAPGGAAESRVKYHERGAYGSWLRASKKLYKESRKAGEHIKYRDFMKRVGRAMRRRDYDPNSRFVTESAQLARSKNVDPLLHEAQALNLLEEGIKVETAPTYFHRMWNQKRLQLEEARFKAISQKWITQEIDRVVSESEQAAKFINENDKDAYVEEIVDAVYDKLTGRAFDDVPDWIIPVKRGPLQERTFKIPDEMVEDFLEDDAEVVLRRYTRTMAAETELARKFDTPDMKKQLAEIKDDYKELRKNVQENKSLSTKEINSKLKSLKAAEDRDIKNIEAFRDLLRGTYLASEHSTAWSKVTRAALAWNYTRLLGGVLATSIPDTAKLIGVHGLRATMGEGLPELVRGIRGVSMSIKEAKELGAVSETILNSRLATLADITDPYAYGSAFERFVDNGTRIFSKFTGLTYWNDTVKSISSTMAINRILRNSLKNFDKLPKFEKSWMAYLGIDSQMATRISRQYEEFGQRQGSAFVANTHLWNDKQAKMAFAAALNKDVDRTIVTKGVADQPLRTRTNVGKLIFQFKSFALAAHQRTLIVGLQERPHRFAEMLIWGTAMGMMISWLKYVERGDTDKANALLDNPGLWIADGLDRSGIFPVFFELSNTAEKLGSPAGIKSGLQTAFGDDRRDMDVSRYASRDKLGSILGPSANLFTDIATFAEQASKGDLKRSGANALLRQIPGGTLPGARTILYKGARPMLQEAVQ